MRVSDGEPLCQEARVYYYDLLCPDETIVPPSVRRHVASCPFCREQIGRLRETLFELERQPGDSRMPTDETIEVLAEQFQLLDERVTCSDARPCLPQLAMASPQIRIPTPVTVHVDQCPQCARDLTALRKLRLTTDQLRRLGQLFASGNSQELLPPPAGSRPVGAIAMPCREVSQADLFDAVVPFGAPPSRRQQAIAAHIRACPICLGRAQRLHGTIRAILARADSEIETVYHTAGDTQDAPAETPDTYQYPVSVEVVRAGSGAAPDSRGPRGISLARLRDLRHSTASVALTAAVVIVVVALTTLLRTTAPTASGTHVGQSRKAIEKAPNVHIIVTNENVGPVQEFLIARRSDRLVHRTTTTQKCNLYDLGLDLKWTSDPEAGSGAPTRLSKRERDWARQMMASCLLGVLEQISADTKLPSPADRAGRAAGTDFDVYESYLSQQADDAREGRRWLAYIDPTTGLPQKLESYRHGPAGRDWRLVTTTVYTYPTDQQMADSMRTLFPAP